MNKSVVIPVRSCAITLLILTLAVSACANLADTAETQDTQALYTAAAQTYSADMTLQAGITAVARLTELARTPTAAPPTSTHTPEPSATAPPATPTPPPPLPTSTPQLCDWAEFVSDVTVPDNTSFQPGADFSKAWRVRNIGSCTWSAGYSLVFTGGDLMSAARSLPLPGVISPGKTVDLRVDLRAPASPGVYRGEWMLRNPAGDVFGIAANALEPFWVQIQVNPIGSSNRYAYDFVANFCLADWSNGSQRLNCPGDSSDRGGSIPADGFVLLLDRPALETRVENEPALWTRPAASKESWIVGEYPPYRVRDGDHFLAEIGCLFDSPGCNLRFQLDYRTSNGVVRNLGAWREFYDSNTTLIDIDLSDLEGLAVQFVLSVNNLGKYQDGNAFWFVPHIRNFVEIDRVVLTWLQTSGNACSELKIYLSSRRSGEASAYSCLDGSGYLGGAVLTGSEVDRLVEFYDRLNSFNAEVFNAATEELNYLVFSGGGVSDAVSVDIELLTALASSLFDRITR
ncbi:MAG TPA: NBR1-Ig-like domain-containing protein [Anaerolineales bacterium]|nr:NBR1-Ig-like domain-containing protein [Anaerolineales bacterium]